MILQTAFSKIGLLAKCAGAVRKQIPYALADLKASTLVSVIAEKAQNHSWVCMHYVYVMTCSQYS